KDLLRKEGDPLDQRNLVVAKESRKFRRLVVGDEVKAGQILALVDPIHALNDLTIKKATLDSRIADRLPSQLFADEGKERDNPLQSLSGTKAASVEEVSLAKMVWERSLCDEQSKAQLTLVAERELQKSQTALRMHEIRSSISGVVTSIFKTRGEAVYQFESVF